MKICLSRNDQSWEFIKKKEDVKTFSLSWWRSCFLSCFLAQDLVFFLISRSRSCFSYFLGQDLVFFLVFFLFSWARYLFLSWSKACFLFLFLFLILLFSWSKACFLTFFLKSFFYKFPTQNYRRTTPTVISLSSRLRLKTCWIKTVSRCWRRPNQFLNW